MVLKNRKHHQNSGFRSSSIPQRFFTRSEARGLGIPEIGSEVPPGDGQYLRYPHEKNYEISYGMVYF
jgi:hypothetical protein